MQNKNADQHHHPIEKTYQVEKLLLGNNLNILEANAGWGNLTQVYSKYGNVLSLDIKQDRIDCIKKLELSNVETIKCDSFYELHRLIYKKYKFDVVDLDPYGFPSRFFPHVFLLIKDGLLFVTFPKMGVQQINKIMVEHYRVFWDISLEDKNVYVDKVISKIKDYGFCYGRDVELIDTLELDRMYRLAFKVERRSMLDLVGLKVKGINY